LMRRKNHPDATLEEAETEAMPETSSTEADGITPDTASVPDAQAPCEDVAKLQAQIAELAGMVGTLTDQVKTEHDQYLRAVADFQNYRRRSDEQRSDDRQFANREFIVQLLPILDNFERAMVAAETTKTYDTLVTGVALTLRQLQDYLTKQGVESIEAVGTEFDPNFHEAVLRIEDSEHPDNTVVEEVQKGYRMGARVLRPSMVKVARSA
jgi:molecular chaperone GrpE